METNKRVLALDVFRGLTIAGMIMVNNPGSWGNVYPPLLHADWHGVTPTDWIFPFFLFIVGISISLALGKRKAKGVSYGQISRKIVSRTLIIFGLGLFMGGFPKFGFTATEPKSIKAILYLLLGIAMISIFWRAVLDQKQFASPATDKRRRWLLIGAGIAALLMIIIGFPYYDISNHRIPGVLQRIALVYGACAFLFLYTKPTQQLVIGIGLLFLYYFMMFVVPVPGGYAPNLEAETNLGAWVDRMVFTSDHLWRASKTWDPEGLLSTIPAISTGISGMLVGTWMKKDIGIYEKISGLFAIGVLVLVGAFMWDTHFPFNKKIWSSSFVLFTSGVGMILLATIYWLVDAKGYTGWIKPFQVYGMNALFAYILSGIFAVLMFTIKWPVGEGEMISLQGFLYKNLYTSWMAPKVASLAYALTNVGVILAACWVLYKKKIYIKV